jgi:hypothetical protein
VVAPRRILQPIEPKSRRCGPGKLYWLPHLTPSINYGKVFHSGLRDCSVDSKQLVNVGPFLTSSDSVYNSLSLLVAPSGWYVYDLRSRGQC